MRTTFLHTADWQLGKPFASVQDEQKRARIQQERIEVLGRIADVARQHQAEFIVVAGDLFDSTSASNATVSAALSEIGKIEIRVFAIPGNHDHSGPGSLWEQAFYQRERERLAPNLQILLAPEPVETESAILFPCPLSRRHESADPTAWLRSIEAELPRFADKSRVVLAHGSVQGFTSEGDEEDVLPGAPNLINLSRLPTQSFDYIALGDWHGMKQVADRAWYAGTPEIDRFPKGAINDPGHVLVVSVQRDAVPEVTPIRTAGLGWHRFEHTFQDAGLDQFRQKIHHMFGNRVGEDLLNLTLRGSLGIEAMTRLEEEFESLQARLLRLKIDNQTTLTPSTEELEALTQRSMDPLIAQVASRLVSLAQRSDEDTCIARIALRELYAVCNQR
jgi:DNA repair exonuclease SbcCD nuclease subunit